jgi:hypothetical protein
MSEDRGETVAPNLSRLPVTGKPYQNLVVLFLWPLVAGCWPGLRATSTAGHFCPCSAQYQPCWSLKTWCRPVCRSNCTRKIAFTRDRSPAAERASTRSTVTRSGKRSNWLTDHRFQIPDSRFLVKERTVRSLPEWRRNLQSEVSNLQSEIWNLRSNVCAAARSLR